MGRTPYWNDPQIAERRAHELDRALPTRRKARKPRGESHGTGSQQVLERNATAGQGADRSSVN
jgi:hypothetical protein